MKRFFRSLAACFAVLHAGVGWGQSPPHGLEPRPVGHKAPDKPLSPQLAAAGEFRSAFSDYRRFDPDMPLLDWRAANEEVKNAGGHVGLLRAQGADGDRPRTEHKAATPTPTPKGHH